MTSLGSEPNRLERLHVELERQAERALKLLQDHELWRDRLNQSGPAVRLRGSRQLPPRDARY